MSKTNINNSKATSISKHNMANFKTKIKYHKKIVNK